MITPVIIKSMNAFSSIVKKKLCSNLKDTMYFLSFFAFTRTKVVMGSRRKWHVFMFSSLNAFKTLSELLLILDFINHIHYCIRHD